MGGVLNHSPQAIPRVGGRRFVLALGGLYVAIAATAPVTLAGGRSADELLILGLLVGVSGLVLFYGGYRLPGTNIRPDLYHVVASWCLRAVGVMLGILVFIALVTDFKDFAANVLILTSLASIAGLGMGYHDGKAKTRAVDAEEYAQELERYQTIVETVNDGIVVVDEDDRFALVNDSFTELVGYDREELLGSHTSLVETDETDAEAITEQVERDLADGALDAKTYESTVKTASGETLETESTIALLPSNEEEDASRDTVVVVRDVTERNERERQLGERNEQLNNFASMLAHELRNPVNIGQIYSQQLPRRESSKAVEYVTQAFDRIESIIDAMLIITRGEEAITENVSIDLADVARDVWEEIDAPDATLDVRIDRTIEADETYVRQLFRNLFENAVEHGSTSNRPSDDDAVEHGSTSNRPEVNGSGERGGRDVTVTVGELPTGFFVADDGVGIPADDREEVFDAGYTSAANDGGMGLGLTFVKEMADAYGWEYGVTESDAGGAQFEFENVTETRSVTE